jgi:16S rRNA (guanine(966)-N(2))-methyltransferase RsmD
MTRIIGGEGKGRRLESVKGQATRPTASRVRQTLFDILAPRISGSRFLDAFAGSGGVGLEALSRGAARVVFVEQAADAVAVLKRNVARLGSAAPAEVHRQDALVALAALADAGRRFDLIYVDPPYEGGLYEAVLEEVGRTALLDHDGRLVAEHFHKRALPETIGGLVRIRSVRVGDHRLSFYARPDHAAGTESSAARRDE